MPQHFLSVYNRHYDNIIYRYLSDVVARELNCIPARDFRMTPAQRKHHEFMILAQDAAYEVCGAPKRGKVITLALDADDLSRDVWVAVQWWLNEFIMGQRMTRARF